MIAALLAVNLLAKTEQRAEAGVQGTRESDAQPGGGDPYIVGNLSWAAGGVYHVWSDGQIDRWRVAGQTCEATFDRVMIGPADHNFPVVSATVESERFVEVFADGRIDVIIAPDGVRCTFEGTGGQFCLGDIDRNGDTNFDDLLFVLRDWGACEG